MLIYLHVGFPTVKSAYMVQNSTAEFYHNRVYCLMFITYLIIHQNTLYTFGYGLRKSNVIHLIKRVLLIFYRKLEKKIHILNVCDCCHLKWPDTTLKCACMIYISPVKCIRLCTNELHTGLFLSVSSFFFYVDIVLEAQDQTYQ